MRPRKKNGAKTVKKETPPVTPPTEAPKEVPPKQEEIRDNLMAGVPISEQQKKSINHDLEMLVSRTKEFLTSFLIIGYNLDEIPIQIIYGKTQKDLDALNLALSRFIMLNSSRNLPPPPPDPTDPHHDPH